MKTVAFHTNRPTDLAEEITLAENLYIGGLLKWGVWRLPRVVRADPAAVWGSFAYCRVPNDFGWSHRVFHGVPYHADTRATNAEILTPSHEAWPTFRQRLGAEIAADDFEWRYAPARRCECGKCGWEYWPLASAEIVAAMGFAVAETLATLNTFMGTTDREVFKHTEGLWNKTKPRPGVIPFDVVAAHNGGATNGNA